MFIFNKKYRFLLSIILSLFLVTKNVAAEDHYKRQTMKLGQVLTLLNHYYLDSVDFSGLTEKAIIRMFSELDPHSSYLHKDELIRSKEQMGGSFGGIGIKFNILRDTLFVVRIVPGGPSEKIGLKAGDRIVKVDDKNIAGIGIRGSDVRRLLKGPPGSQVKVYVSRKQNKKLTMYSITRNKIPLNSIDSYYMIDDEIGYIKLNRFSARTTEEFNVALDSLLSMGMKELILDIQSNKGGYLNAAYNVASELLGADKMVVYMEGLHIPRKNWVTIKKGKFENGQLIVIVNEGSASASEIVAGAIQDWDRGLIIGRRTYGKGLIQREFKLLDASAIRLTIAEYYTPSGRNIQKPYKQKSKSYFKKIGRIFNNGEIMRTDSIDLIDSLAYTTMEAKRTVYGGGGIMPDIFIPIDTTGKKYTFFNQLNKKNIINLFIINYIDKHREELNIKYPDFKQFNDNFFITDEMLTELEGYAVAKNIKKNEKDFEISKSKIKWYMKAIFAGDLWSTSAFYEIYNSESKEINAAIQLLKENQAYIEVLE